VGMGELFGLLWAVYFQFGGGGGARSEGPRGQGQPGPGRGLCSQSIVVQIW